MARILVIDDDQLMCDTFSSLIKRLDHDVECAFTLNEGLHKAQDQIYDVVFLDVRMPDGDGLTVLPRLREIPDPPEVIIITGYGDPDGAELAVKNGAWDYLEKGSIHRQMKLSLSRALQYRESKQAKTSPVSLKCPDIIGKSAPIESCLDKLALAAGTNANVLITGETGTGKELFARAVHENSSRADRPLVVVDCAALPESLTESVLFGHEKGAFTGADRFREGLIRQADGGTLFLDEVGELPMTLQKAFLRALETRRFRPIGGQTEIRSDFRLVAATNRNLEKMVESSQFRKDLLFRLKALTIELPPLREHKEDLRDLAIFYMNEICERHGNASKGFAPEVFPALALHDWPGNVRELIHAMEIAYASAQNDPMIMIWHLPEHVRILAARASVSKGSFPAKMAGPGTAWIQHLPTWQEFKDHNELEYLNALVTQADWDIKKASQISGLGRTRLYELLKKHNLSR